MILAFLKGLPLSLKVAAPIIALLLILLGVSRLDAARAWRKVTAEGFRADSIGAVLDTTRIRSDRRLQKLLGDSVLYERRVLQLEAVPSALAQALNSQASSIASLTATVAPLIAKLTSTTPTTETADGTRVASVNVSQPSHSGTVSVEVPKPPGAARWDFNLRVEPAPLSLLLSCSAPVGNARIREARANVTAPAWLTVSINRVEQERDVCNPDPVTGAKNPQKRFGLSCSVGPTLTAVDNKLAAQWYGATCGASYRIFP